MWAWCCRGRGPSPSTPGLAEQSLRSLSDLQREHARRRAQVELAPAENPVSSVDQMKTLETASCIVADIALVMAEDEVHQARAGSGASFEAARAESLAFLRRCNSESAAAAAQRLRVPLIPRGASASERAARMRYVKAAAERLFAFLDEMTPVDASVRDARRAQYTALQSLEKRVDLVLAEMASAVRDG